MHWTAIGAAGTTDSKLLGAYAEIADALIGQGVDVNHRDDLGLAPMDWLPAAADSPIAIMLHDHGGERAVTGPVGAAVSGLLASLDEAVDDGDISKSGPCSTCRCPLSRRYRSASRAASAAIRPDRVTSWTQW